MCCRCCRRNRESTWMSSLHITTYRIRFPVRNRITLIFKNVKVKWSRYRPDVSWRVGRGIALLFHDRGTRRGWVVSSTPLPQFIPGNDPVPVLQEAGWAPGPAWTDGKYHPPRDSIPVRTVQPVASVTIPTELPGPQLWYLFLVLIED